MVFYLIHIVRRHGEEAANPSCVRLLLKHWHFQSVSITRSYTVKKEMYLFTNNHRFCIAFLHQLRNHYGVGLPLLDLTHTISGKSS